MLHFSQLKKITAGTELQLVEDLPVLHLLTDSRKLLVNVGSVFFAISGVRHDSHQFLQELYERGIRQFVVEKKISPALMPEANILQVGNSISALQRIASEHRKQFSLPVVGITGSNGKTIVKEWLSQMLSPKLKIVKSPKSYNSQVGVPLSVWQIRPEHEIGIFEAGISQSGEMAHLEKVILPDIGIFTNIGTAHDEGFKDRHQKIIEKSRLFSHSKKLIYCRDHAEIHDVLSQKNAEAILVSWGKNVESSIRIVAFSKSNNTSELTLTYKSLEISFTFPFNDDASIENSMHCISFLLSEEFNPALIQQQLNQLDTISKRLELKQGINECYLIDDTYNNDFAGLLIALDFMGQQKQHEKRTVIISDLPQTGQEEATLYKSIGRLLQDKGISRIIGIGPALARNKGYFEMDSSFFGSTEEFISHLNRKNFAKELVLIKGARAFHFGRIVALLQQKMHGTVLEIDLDALTHNLNFYRSRLSGTTKIMVMVKAFAYGSGSHEVANLLQFHRVDYLAVAYVDEGVTLRENGISIPIMVMNPSPNNFGQLVRYRLEPEIYSISMMKAWISFSKHENRNVPIHIKLDTGMHRLGFEKKDLPELIKLLKESPQLKVASIFSHLAGSDEAAHNTFSHSQVGNFKTMTDIIKKEAGIEAMLHILNSPGIIRFPEYHFDMVRLGIGLYGVEVNRLHQHHLLPISTLKTTISQIKEIQKGETVGYSRRGVAEMDMKIATIAIGYADGFNRAFSRGKGHVLLHGQKAPVVGNVCMDMTMIDITGMEAEEGDEVIIFGKDRPISDIAAEIGTIPYEILTNVSERVKRIFFTE